MDDTNSLIEQRKAKLAALRAKGIDPFKNKFTPGETCKHAHDNYTEGREVAVAGRITAHREMGKSMFLDVRDQSGRLQIYAQKNHLEETAPGSWDIFTHLDLGDFIGAQGKLFTTKTGEISIKLDSFVILAKALRPPPEKWHGLADTEIRYRQRYLDLMSNPDVKDVMLKRSEIIREIRNFLHSRGFVEVETPMMQAIPGGAAAQPFKTHHNALGCDFYLRIALELYLKRLLVGGVDKVFEIGRNFRNEGLSRKHNPEFTMLEAYQAFGDYESMMELVESMVKHVAQKVLGTLVIHHDRREAFIHALNVMLHRIDEFIALIYKLGTKQNVMNQPENLHELREQFVKLIERTNSGTVQDLAKETESLLNRFHQAASGWAVISVGHGDDWQKNKKLVQKDILGFAAAIKGNISQFLNAKTIDLASPWRRVKYKDLVQEVVHNKIGVDWFQLSIYERLVFADYLLEIDLPGGTKRKEAFSSMNLGLNLKSAHAAGDKATFEKELNAIIGRLRYSGCEVEDFEITAAVFEKLIEPTLIQPTFVTHLPKELVPLAKLSPDDPTTVEVFECCINGQEIAPAYTEQNDPIEQRERLEHQAGGEQQKLDEDFLVALEHGMPPAGGMGMGIDRLCMMLLGQESIRDVILFPQLKPK